MTAFEAQGGAGKPRVGQLPVSYDTDRDAAVARAHAQFRWALGGWDVNAELPGPAGFAGATRYTRPEDVADAIPCGDDVNVFVDAVRPFADADSPSWPWSEWAATSRSPSLDWAETKLLPALREL